MESPRWKIITPSQYEWERRGLDFIRTGLPDHDPYRAWANFEFQTDDGAIYEVDLLVLTKQGFWLVECKAWGGRIWGDAGTWTRSTTARSARKTTPSFWPTARRRPSRRCSRPRPPSSKVRLPWLDALVFLSADDVQCDLTGTARNRVLLKDRPQDRGPSRTQGHPRRPHQPGRSGHRSRSSCRHRHQGGQGALPCDGTGGHSSVAAVTTSRRLHPRRLIADGPGYQDRLAKHASFDNVFCRVRQYTVAQASSEEERQRLQAGGGS